MGAFNFGGRVTRDRLQKILPWIKYDPCSMVLKHCVVHLSLRGKSSLSSVFIFDIKSQTWMEQIVTAANGTDGLGSTSNLDPGGHNENMVFSRQRMSTCAVVGSTKDNTSHNIVVLGGQTESTALLETWLLSLPR